MRDPAIDFLALLGVCFALSCASALLIVVVGKVFL